MPKHVIFGAPGTGKTTRLLKIIEGLISKGIHPSEICFCTFSKAGANEARERAIAKFGFDKKDVLFYGTIHSLCYKQFCVGHHLVKRGDFFKEAEIEYKEVKEDMDMINDYIQEDGNVIITFYDKLRLYFKKDINGFKKEELIPCFYKLPMGEGDYNILFGGITNTYEVLRAYEKYKEETETIDYVDMLLLAYKKEWVIPTSILMVDEFQDLSPLQYEIYKIWSRGKKEVYISGDDDQCLFPDTKIQTDNGIKLIKDLSKKDKVLSNLAAGHTRLMHILKIKKQKCNKKCLEIKTLKGNSIRCTENHHFFATLTKNKETKGWSGKTNRKTVNLCCLYSARKERKTPYYSVILESKNKRERFDFQDYLAAKGKARELAEKEDAKISERWSFSEKDKNNKFFKIRAMNLLEGMKIPRLENGKIGDDEIISIKPVKEPEFVYDIEVEGTHNYCAENIFISNTIYTFICANSEFLLKERESLDACRGDEEIILEKTYRLPKKIQKYCSEFIKNIKGKRVEKKIISLKEGGEIMEENINENLEKIFDFIREEKSTFILFRTNYYKNQFNNLLIQKGVIYNEIRGQGIWNNRTINLFNASVKLVNHKPLTYEETKYLIDAIPYKLGLLKKGLKSQFKNMEPEPEYTFLRLLGLGVDMSFFNYCNYNDIYEILNIAENVKIMFKESKKELIKIPIKISIGTIHSAKGKEVEDTIILKDIPIKIAQTLGNNPSVWDNEIRVFLVGISRSKERLTMLRGGFSRGDTDVIP